MTRPAGESEGQATAPRQAKRQGHPSEGQVQARDKGQHRGTGVAIFSQARIPSRAGRC